MKSKLFTYKILIPAAVIVALLITFSFLANTVIVQPRIDAMNYQEEYGSKLTADGQFLIEFAPGENGKKFGKIERFQGGDYYLTSAELPLKYDDIDITVIKEDSFCNIKCLENVTISKSITAIEDNAFKNCKKLKNVYVPASVSKISGNAFADAGSFTMYVEKDSYAETFAKENGINIRYYVPKPIKQETINYKKTVLDASFKDYLYSILYNGSMPFCAITGFNSMSVSGVDIVIPQQIDNVNVTTVMDEAIICGSIETVTLPDTVTAVGDCAFFECSSLKKVYFTENVVYIGESIFKGSPNAVICAPKDSYAHKYATEHKIKFEEVKK